MIRELFTRLRSILHYLPVPWLRPGKGTAQAEYLTEEHVRSRLTGAGNRVRFLPIQDTYTEETEAMRRAYRYMLKDPVVKAALLTKMLAVAALDIQVHAASERAIDKEAAEFVKYALQKARGGTRHLALAILFGGLIDGFSICEKVWMQETRGRWNGKWRLRALKAKDSEFAWLLGDEFRNVVAVVDRRTNTEYNPTNFAIWQHMPLFEAPTGMSDLRAAYRCYDDATEILTASGWKRFGDLTDQDAVAALDTSNGPGRLVYQIPTERVSYPYQGRMFRQQGRAIDLCVTPNHRMWVGTREARRFRFVEAAELMESKRGLVRYKRDAEWEGEEHEFFALPAVEHRKGGPGRPVAITKPSRQLPMDDWLRFLGFWLAEGNAYRKKNGNRQCSVTITQNEGPALEEFCGVVERLGFNYCIKKRKNSPCRHLEISSLQLWSYIRKLGKSHAKYIPDEFKGLPPQQLKILLEWMNKGDGRHGGTQYATVSKRLADDVGEIALKAGMAATIFREKTKAGGIWIVGLNTQGIDGTLVNEGRDQRSWEEYDGPVHCVTVPSGIVYVRRNGKACWCGNSYWLIDTAWQLRGIGLERYTLPMMKATYLTPDHKAELETALPEMRSQAWITIPQGAQIEAMSLAATSGESEFAAAIRDLREDLVLGIAGAVLQMLQGQVSDGRGNSQVHKSTAELLQWFLAAEVGDVLTDQVAPDLVSLNFQGADYPKVTLGGVNDSTLMATIQVDDLLLKMGLPLSREEVYLKTGRSKPTDEADTLAPPAPPGAGVLGLGGGGVVPGAFADDESGGPVPPDRAAGPQQVQEDTQVQQADTQTASSVADLQKSYTKGDLSREAAVANATLLLQIDPEAAEKLFPPIPPQGGTGAPPPPTPEDQPDVRAADSGVSILTGTTRRMGDIEEFCGGKGSKKPGPCPTKAKKPPVAKEAAAAKPAAAPKVKGPAPGSQMKPEVRDKLRAVGMVGTFPPADVKIEDVKIADTKRDPKALEFEPLMSWTQKTKSGRLSMQYRYTQAFHDRNAADKHQRVAAIEPHIDGIAEKLRGQMGDTALPQRKREAAAIAALIGETGLRPTDGEDSVAHGHFGISSLQARHVTIKGGRAYLDFMGKEGVRNKAVIKDPANVVFLKQALARTGGAEDFIFKEATSDNAGAALKAASVATGGPKDIKIKDLRTLKATQMARRIVGDFPGPPPPLTGDKKKDIRAIQKAILTMSGHVARVLNNEPTEARDTYIHPEIFKQWQSKLAVAS